MAIGYLGRPTRFRRIIFVLSIVSLICFLLSFTRESPRYGLTEALHDHQRGSNLHDRLHTRSAATLQQQPIIVASSHGLKNSNNDKHSQQTRAGAKFLVGAGKADITGPVVELNLAGYADLRQTGSGLRQRLYSRAFIVGDASAPDDAVVYVVLETQAGDTAVRRGILEGVAALGPEYGRYGRNNIVVASTHTHAGPGAWYNYLLPQITSLGFSKQSYQAIVDGAVLSIKRAHESLQEGYLDVGTADVDDGNINRSGHAYLANPSSERAKYPSDTDTTMTLLRLRRASDLKAIAVVTWFAVHPTSLLRNNTHVAGDNKGVAAYLLERKLGDSDRAAPGFVAAFSQANHADTSPNVLGAWCEDGSGQMCNAVDGTCADGTVDACHGRGPRYLVEDLGVSSCYEMGRRQADAAMGIIDSLGSSSIPITGGGSVRSLHFFHDMSFWNFTLPNGTEAQTCPAALGYSFAAGTTDGPGAFDFKQGNSGPPDASPLWAVVSRLLRTPTAEQRRCQREKPILLDVGGMREPYPWSPNIIDIQAVRVGQLVIIASPCEVTTMSGRRWREAVAASAAQFLDEEPIVMLTSPANTYAHYVTTPEEYSVQRYEGASTLYGPYTLPALINLTVSNLAAYLSPSSSSASHPPEGPLPADNRRVSLNFNMGVVLDSAPLGKQSFGHVTTQPDTTYAVGHVARAVFVGANPRNNLRLEETFAAVERRAESGQWVKVRDDGDWALVYSWARTSTLLGRSEVTISWETGADEAVEPGAYRFRYYGDAKTVGGAVSAFEGVSNVFTLS